MNWQTTTIGEAFEFTSKPRTLAALDQIPFVPMDLIPAGGRINVGWVAKPRESITSGMYFEKGDILLSRITPCFENGKQAIADDLPAPYGYASTEVIPIKAIPDRSDATFLFYFLLESGTRTEMASRMEGSTGRQRLSKSVVRDWPMLLPPLPEQRRIAAVLAKVQEAVEVEEDLVRISRELKQAALRQLFTRGLRGEALKETEIGMMPVSWEVVPLGSLGRIGNGSTPRRTDPGYWDGGDIAWLTSAKVYDRIVRRANEFVTSKAVRECHLPLIPPGSIIVAITGQGKTLGNVARVAIETTMSQHVAFLVIKKEDVDPDFVRYYLETCYAQFRQVAAGGGSTKGALTCGFLKHFPIPIADSGEQREIASSLRTIDSMISHHEGRQRLLRELFRTLLRDLMTGRRRVAEGDESVFETEPC